MKVSKPTACNGWRTLPVSSHGVWLGPRWFRSAGFLFVSKMFLPSGSSFTGLNETIFPVMRPAPLMFKFFTFYAPMSLVPARAWHDLDGEELRVEESRNNTCPSITAIFFTSPTCRQLLTPFVGGVMSDKKRREVKFSWVLRALEPEGSLLGGGGRRYLIFIRLSCRARGA